MVTSDWRFRVLLGCNLAFIVGVLTGYMVLSAVALLACAGMTLTCSRLGPNDLAIIAPLLFCLVWLAIESVPVSGIVQLAVVASAILAQIWRARRSLAKARALVIAEGMAEAKRLGFTGYIPIKAKLTGRQESA